MYTFFSSFKKFKLFVVNLVKERRSTNRLFVNCFF